MTLDGKKIAILIAPRGTEEPEFVQPRQAVQDAGAEVTVIGLEPGEARTNNSDLDPGGSYAVDMTIDQVSAEQFDGLIIPGGTVGADTLRGNGDVINFVEAFFDQKKPVGAICHGPWLLVEADVLDDRSLTSYLTLQTDIENAGGNWLDEEVIVDEGLVTSRNPDDLPAFCAKIVDEFGEGRHAAS
ncbi:type 1 glutamine amidotransferase domain-containing protein [Sphingobium sp. CR28]|uniref:type 1 glutamine amidotransferase domain-containing protein n=1 Tax=Sphingobium sp. CR28 TaxID=3400272 RepID=UPI003FEF74FD